MVSWKDTKVVISRPAAGLLLILLAGSAWAAESISGRVFEDRNYTGTLEPGEPGIARVRVSNGVDVVVTDDAGGYRLQVSDEAVIFITKPSGYATPVNEHQRGAPPTVRSPRIPLANLTLKR